MGWAVRNWLYQACLECDCGCSPREAQAVQQAPVQGHGMAVLHAQHLPCPSCMCSTCGLPYPHPLAHVDQTSKCNSSSLHTSTPHPLPHTPATHCYHPPPLLFYFLTSLWRSAFLLGSRLLKTGRMGSPWTTICSSDNPMRRPRFLQNSVGTKHLVTPG